MFWTVFAITVIVFSIFVLISVAQNAGNSENLENYKREEYDRVNAQVSAPGKVKIVQDCVKLVNETKNPQVFFERYRLLIEQLQDLAEMEKYVKFTGKSNRAVLMDFQSRKALTVNSFVDRFYESTYLKMLNLSTEKAKLNNADKFYKSLMLYQEDIPAECVGYIENKYNMLKLSIN